jgi:prepilin-type N-terminal cleavage/methylation domain-containing protein
MRSTNLTPRGFTLIELIVSIAIMTMIGLGVVAFQQGVIRNTKVLQSNLQAESQIRKTLLTFIEEMRAARPSASGSYAIESAGTSSVVFFANIDATPDTERVRYFLATATQAYGGAVIKKGVTKPTGTTYSTANEKIQTMVFNVKNGTSSPLFLYFDSSYTGTSSPLTVPINIPSVRMIRMQIVIDPNAARSPVMQTYTSQVTPRNLKSNL